MTAPLPVAITITQNEANTMLQDVLTTKLAYGEVVDLVVTRMLRELGAELAKLPAGDNSTTKLPREALVKLVKRFLNDADKAKLSLDRNWRKGEESGYSLTLRIDLEDNDMPAGFAVAEKARLENNKRRGELSALMHRLSKRQNMRELRAGLLERVILVSKEGKKLSQALETIVAGAKERLLAKVA